MRVLEFLGWNNASTKAAGSGASAETETVRKIAAALDRLDPDRARYIAAFAYILSRVARADLDISREETLEMERIVREKGGLPEELAVMIVQMAKTQNVLFGGTENYLVTREFNKIASKEQKLALLQCLFAVSAADAMYNTRVTENSRHCIGPRPRPFLDYHKSSCRIVRSRSHRTGHFWICGQS